MAAGIFLSSIIQVLILGMVHFAVQVVVGRWFVVRLVAGGLLLVPLSYIARPLVGSELLLFVLCLAYAVLVALAADYGTGRFLIEIEIDREP